VQTKRTRMRASVSTGSNGGYDVAESALERCDVDWVGGDELRCPIEQWDSVLRANRSFDAREDRALGDSSPRSVRSTFEVP
jgi:hypothetical protein